MNQLRNQYFNEKEEELNDTSPIESEEERKYNPLQQIFSDEQWDIKKIARYIPFTFFMVGLGMLYITNIHILENKVRKIEKLSKEVKELSWEYKTRKAELMYKSKQTEVENVVDTLGIKVLTEPPKKIIVAKSEN